MGKIFHTTENISDILYFQHFNPILSLRNESSYNNCYILSISLPPKQSVFFSFIVSIVVSLSVKAVDPSYVAPYFQSQLQVSDGN